MIPFNVSDYGATKPTTYGYAGASQSLLRIVEEQAEKVIAVNCSFSFDEASGDRPIIYDTTEALALAGIYVVASDTGNYTPKRNIPGSFNKEVIGPGDEVYVSSTVADHVIAVSYMEFENTQNNGGAFWWHTSPGMPASGYADTDIFAPSRDIRTCHPTGYKSRSGVSFGCPAVTAALALIAGKNDSSEGLKSQLLDMARPICNFGTVDGYPTYKALDVSAINPIETPYLALEQYNWAVRDTAVTSFNHRQMFIPDDPATPQLDNNGLINVFLRWQESPVEYEWLSYDIPYFWSPPLTATQTLTTIHLQQDTDGDVSALFWIYDTNAPTVHTYKEMTYSAATETWSGPFVAFSIIDPRTTNPVVRSGPQKLDSSLGGFLR